VQPVKQLSCMSARYRMQKAICPAGSMCRLDGDMTIVNHVRVFTGFFAITGEISPGPAGMYSHMNLPTSSHLELGNVEIVPLYKLSAKPVQRDRLWLVKERIAVVVLERVMEMGTSSLSRRGFTRPFPHWVRGELGDFEISGQLQLGGNYEFGEVLSKGERNFIPLYKARLGSALYPALELESPVMLFNCSWLQSMALLTPREIPEGETST